MNQQTWVLGPAAALAALSVTLLLPSMPSVPRVLSSGVPDRDEHRSGGGGVLRSPPLLLAGLLALGVAGWRLDGTQLVLAVVALGAVAGVHRLVLRSRSAVAADRRAEQVLALCDAMASDLAAGQPPLAALDRAAEEWEEFTPVSAAGSLGADVPDAMRSLAERPGAGQLRALAAAWQVASRSGAGLADAIARSASSMREERDTSRLVSSELAAAHATARMMAALPIGVLLLGSGVGGDPVGFLTSTPVGLGCLAGGLLLSYAGLVWLHRLADGVLAR